MRSQKTVRGGKRSLKRPPRRKKVKRAKCPVSGKTMFPARLDAVSSLARIQTVGHPQAGKIPQRVYRCPDCGGWHLTSQTKGRS